jgi:hypothetical protein
MSNASKGILEDLHAQTHAHDDTGGPSSITNEIMKKTITLHEIVCIRGYIQKFPDGVDNEINNNNKNSLRTNTKCYGGEIHYTDSQNSDTTAPSGRELYHLQFSLQEAIPLTFGYTLVYSIYLMTFSQLQETYKVETERRMEKRTKEWTIKRSEERNNKGRKEKESESVRKKENHCDHQLEVV